MSRRSETTLYDMVIFSRKRHITGIRFCWLQFLHVVGWCFLASRLPFGPVPVSSQATPTLGDANALNSSSTDFVCDSQCELRQRAALRQLYTETNLDGTWINSTGWDGKIDSHFCFWHGVFCCPSASHGFIIQLSYAAPGGNISSESSCNGGVRALVLFRNGLAGELPVQSLVNLNSSTLVLLDLESNALYGTLPLALAQLTSLSDLRMSYNHLSGSIPDVWREMADLSILRLSGNKLTGSVPFDYFSNLASLRMMDIMRNKLNGSPPLELIFLPQFESLVGSHNEFNAPLRNTKDTTGVLSLVREVDLSYNHIPGTLPYMLGSAALYVLDLGFNQLTGSIPEMYGLIHRLILHHNNLNGSLATLPSTNTGVLLLSHNQLAGSLCTDCFTVAQRLHRFDISNNMGITGPLPRCSPFIEQIDISFTSMTSEDLISASPPVAALVSDWLVKENTSMDSALGVPEFAICPSYNIPSAVTYPVLLALSPSYYYYQGCICGKNGTSKILPLYTPADSNGFYTNMECVVPLPPPIAPSHSSHSQFPWWAGVIIAVGTVTLVGIIIYLFYEHVSQLLASRQTLHAKKKPPGLGKKTAMVTLVITDVESSTELWEWDPPGLGVMSEALAIHDRALRHTLAAHYGYEVTTEGDAFINAFHEPLDAVAWCLATQVELLNAAWPLKLLGHPRAMPVTSLECSRRPPTIPADSTPTAHDSTQSNKHRSWTNGFLSGMGRSRFLSMNSMTQTATECGTPQAQRAMIIGLRVRMGVASGQCDSITVHKVTRRSEYWGVVYRRAAAISDLPAGGQVLTDSATFHGINGDLADLKSTLQMNGHVVEGEPNRGSLDDPAILDVAPTARSSTDYPLPVGRPSEGRKSSFTLRGGSNFFDCESRRQGVRSQIGRQDTKATEASQGDCMVLDCGIFDLATGYESLTQVMPPGLEKRASFFPPLKASLHLTPGYFDAPGTSAVCQYEGPPAVTLVFCTLQGYRGMVEYNRELAQQVLSLYNTIIRRSLLATGGYECQEQQGSYMIAFQSSTDALEWCLMVQEIIYEVRWTEAMTALPNMLTASQRHRFSGPKVNMGIFTGVPSKVMPHSTTGRADYFGPLVNRAARLCHGAAHGGQVVVSRDVLSQLMSKWGLPEDKALPPPLPMRKVRSLSFSSSPSAMFAQLAGANATCPEIADADRATPASESHAPSSVNGLEQIHEDQSSRMGGLNPSMAQSSASSRDVSTPTDSGGNILDLPRLTGFFRGASQPSPDFSSPVYSANRLSIGLIPRPSLPLKWPLSDLEPTTPCLTKSDSQPRLCTSPMGEVLPEADRCGGRSSDRRASGQAMGFIEDGIWVFPVNIDSMDVKQSRWRMPNKSALKASLHHAMESTVHEPSVSNFDTLLKEMTAPIKRLLTRSRPHSPPPAVPGLSAHFSPFSSFIPAPVSSNSAHLAPSSSFTPAPVIPEYFELSAVQRSSPRVHLETNPFPPPSVQPGFSANAELSFRTSNPSIPTVRDRSGRGGEEGGLDRTSHPASSPLQHLDHGIRSRTTKNKWLWTGSVIVSDMGTFTFKGLSGDQQIFSIMTRSTREKPCMTKRRVLY